MFFAYELPFWEVLNFDSTLSIWNSPFLLIVYGAKMSSANAFQREKEPGK